MKITVSSIITISLIIFGLYAKAGSIPTIIPVPTLTDYQGTSIKRVVEDLNITILCPDSVRNEFNKHQIWTDIIDSKCKNPNFNKLQDAISPESYKLVVNENTAIISASDYHGAIYALHTLAQLLNTPDGTPQTVIITDGPRCKWRGFMLDSGRQFQSTDVIKKYIRMASMLKMNVFHWHLTESLGWRVEISAFPRLTEVGAYVASGIQQQGYYSKKDICDIVAYAHKYAIEIIPEIDIPGHSEAALRAYPEFSCNGDSVIIPETGFTDNIFCAGKDSTISALKIIIDEICELFPSKYIHLGGDEAPKGQWDKCPDCQAKIKNLGLQHSNDLQAWLSTELAAHLRLHGRKAIFWDDVINSPDNLLPDNAVIQWWNYRGNKDMALKNALVRNHEIILSPNYYCYLNFPEKPWRGYGPERTFCIEDAYMNNPADIALSSGNVKLLGITCTLWTDYNLTQEMLDYRLFPRIFALSELMWHNGIRIPLDEFKTIIKDSCNYFIAKGYKITPMEIQDEY